MSVGGQGVAMVDDCRIVYRRAGTDGPPVVLLHGGGIDDATLSWRHTIDALADEYQVYAPDWPGYGDSESIAAPSTTRYVELLAGFLESVRLESAILVGISMGGGAALGYALANPDRVDQLVLVDSYGLGDRVPGGSLWKGIASIPGANSLGWTAMGTSTEATRLGLSSVVANPATLSTDFLEAFRKRAARPGAGQAFERFQQREITADGRASTTYVDDLSELSVPTLLIHGAADPIVPVEWSKRAHDRLAESQLAVLEDCGHWAPRECPAAFNDILSAFLDRTNRE